MHFSFEELSDDMAEVVRSWDSDQEFVCYDPAKNKVKIEQVFKSNEFHCFVAFDEGGEPIGFLAVAFDTEGIMEMENFLNPEYVGEGIGQDFISECSDFAIEEFDYDGPTINLVLEPHNKRAIKVYERAGFSITDECEEWIEMQLEL